MSDWLQIDEDGEIDIEEIMHQIRAHIAARRLSGDQSVVEVRRLAGDHFSSALYDHLYQAIQASDQVTVGLSVVPSRVPLIGPLLDVLRTKMHELVIFYVNRLAGQQVAFNGHIARAFSALVEELERNEATRTEIEALQEEVRALKDQLKASETA